MDLARTLGLDGVPPHVIGQQSFVIGRERRGNALFQCVTLAHQVDFQSCSQSEEVAPRVTVTFGKLIDQLLDAGGDLRNDFLLFSLPQRDLCAERAFEQSLEVRCH